MKQELPSFKITCTAKGNHLFVQFSGHLDEDANFAVIETTRFEEITMDWEEVKNVNSCGIREWLRWANQLPKQIKVNFSNCPKIIVNQFNLINGFLPSGVKIHSFYVPYFCECCEKVTSVLFLNDKHYSGSRIAAPDQVYCNKCNRPVEMDVTPTKYFRFLSNREV